MNDHAFTRRRFIKQLAAGSMMLSLPELVNSATSPATPLLQTAQSTNKKLIYWSMGMKPVFCTAYIDPGVKSHQNQEAYVAKYPMALVSQDNRDVCYAWNDSVKKLNPAIKLLAYQAVAEETGKNVPGVGNAILRETLGDSAWLRTDMGQYATYTWDGITLRIYDYRNPKWQKAFLDACTGILKGYPFAGLFLDQTYVWSGLGLSQAVRAELYSAIRDTIVKLRLLHPDKLIIANSDQTWNGLNGEMNETRYNDLEQETKLYKGHSKPRIELFQYLMKDQNDTVRAAEMFRLALKNRAFFGVGVNYQTIRWYPFLDTILSEYTIV